MQKRCKRVKEREKEEEEERNSRPRMAGMHVGIGKQKGGVCEETDCDIGGGHSDNFGEIV